MKVKIVDVRKPAEAHTVSEILLGGRGDGVCVKGSRLYAATGQHARGILNVLDPNDPKHGMGNGVEVFDVADPEHPVRLGGRFFDKAYCMTVDMWEAAVYGDLLVVNNSLLGVYGLDPDTLSVKWRVLPPEGDKPDAVTGVRKASYQCITLQGCMGRRETFRPRGTARTFVRAIEKIKEAGLPRRPAFVIFT